MFRTANSACSRRAVRPEPDHVQRDKRRTRSFEKAPTGVRIVDLTHAEGEIESPTFSNRVLRLLLLIADDAEKANAGPLELSDRLGFDPRGVYFDEPTFGQSVAEP
jgi:hypothetical protein